MKKILDSFLFVVLLLLLSCSQKKVDKEKAPLPSVDIIHPIRGDIQMKEQLNGQVLYLNKTTITAPTNGYVTAVNIEIGNNVKKGDLLFKIQTKESIALQKTKIANSDQFGIIPVFASVSGFVNKLEISQGNFYISQGDAMATIVENSHQVIQVNAPYESAKLLLNNKNIEVELPDNEVLMAVFNKSVPVVDPISQTQKIFFKLKKNISLPEHLNVIVKFLKEEKSNSILLPKEAVFTNETQDNFWIMKVIYDSLAIKVPIIKGMENNAKIEILSPELNLTDKIIQSGGYALPDSTKVKIN